MAIASGSRAVSSFTNRIGKNVSRQVSEEAPAANVKTSQLEKLWPGVAAAELLLSKLLGDDTIPPFEP